LQIAHTHISSDTTRAFQQRCGREEKGKPHRSFSAATGSKEEDGVVAGLGDGTSYKEFQLTAKHNTKSNNYI
jgi:hypothetical protein